MALRCQRIFGSVARSCQTQPASVTAVLPRVSIARYSGLPPPKKAAESEEKRRLEARLHQEKLERRRREQHEMASRSDTEIIALVEAGKVQAHNLEAAIGDHHRAVSIRRRLLAAQDGNFARGVEQLPHAHFDYASVAGACCENVIGHISIPVGVAGPLLLDGESYMVPLATTEGALVASTHRGCKAITKSGGATSVVLSSGMTRAPLLRVPNARRAFEIKEWLEKPENFYLVAAAFNGTSKFARLASIKTQISGRNVYLRFKSNTGDAMGMNMVSKGVEAAIEVLQDFFPDLDALSLSGNYCTDKKPSAVNWIEGRGHSVVCEATIYKDVVENVLKTSVDALVELNVNKNLIGSAAAGSIGGFNAHAANLVTAIFLATGQDPAQNVESSNCITLLERTESGDLYASVTMPCIEVGTIGGGTHLRAQGACLDILGAKGPSDDTPGTHAARLARVVAATTLAGELSLLSALAAGHLVKSHLNHNRKSNKEAEIGSTPQVLASLEEKLSSRSS